jgi:hypothetical protein
MFKFYMYMLEKYMVCGLYSFIIFTLLFLSLIQFHT